MHYHCVITMSRRYLSEVITAESRNCEQSSQVRLPSQRGRIASLTTFESRWCGSAENPWMIEVAPGQRINITLMDFGLQSGQVSRDPNFIVDVVTNNSAKYMMWMKFGMIIFLAKNHDNVSSRTLKHTQLNSRAYRTVFR